MLRLHRLQSNFWAALGIFHIVFLIIFLTNFPFGKFLVGWDALNPELNIAANLQRAIFSGWQENYGLGTLGGHGFGATLPHTLIVAVMSLIFSLEAIRPVFILLCLYVGGLGMFSLSSSLLHRINQSDEHNKNLQQLLPWISLSATLYYVFNLATTQIFYLPLEAFTVHFACLPWLFLLIITLFKKFTPHLLLCFFILNFFSSHQAFIPSVFIAYMVALLLFLVGNILVSTHKKIAVKKSIVILTITLLANAYWLGPFSYYTVFRNHIFLNSYNNLLSTPDFVEKNQKYGDVENVALLKSFFIEGEVFNAEIFEGWNAHLANPLIPAIGYLLFFLSIVGLVSSLWNPRFRKNLLPFTFVFIFFFITLTTQTIPFSWITQILYNLSSTYEQAFRTAFTKVGIGVGFSFSLFMSIGLFLTANSLY